MKKIQLLKCTLLIVTTLLLFLGCGGGGGGNDSSDPPYVPPAGVLTILSTAPYNGETGVDVDNVIGVLFSNAVNASTLGTNSFLLTSSAGSMAGTVAADGYMAFFTPSAPLAYSTLYTATLTTAVTDSEGATLAAAYTWTFTTQGINEPTVFAVQTTTPTNTATGVDLSSAIGASFNKTLNSATIDTNSFQLISSAGSAAGAVAASGSLATFTPSVSLAPSTQYTATITTAATDSEGVALAAAYTWTFTTKASDVPKNELVSRSTDSSITGTAYHSEFPVISSDGRYVAFVSNAAGLVPGFTGAKRQIFVHDRQTHQTELVSVSSDEVAGDNDNWDPAISSDGRYVVFESYATNLVSDDTNGFRDIYIRDRQAGTTSRVSVGAGGVQANSASFEPTISADGQYVAFTSYADNLSAGVDGNAKSNVYVRDLQLSTNTLVSARPDGTLSTQSSGLPAISADGSRIAFWSYESQLVAGDLGSLWDIFVWDRNATPQISLVSKSSSGVQKNQGDESMSRIVAPAISADGSVVAFSTTADNLVAADTNNLQDVFIHKVATGETSRASVGTGGVQATGGDSSVGQGERIALSTDGTWVAFTTAATNISAGGSNVLLRNNTTNETTAITASAAQFSGSKGPALSGDGRFVAFMSGSQLDPRFASSGVFVQDRTLP